MIGTVEAAVFGMRFGREHWPQSMSVLVLKVTTSASRPSATARAWAEEPPWAWSIFTSLPVAFL